LPVAKKLTAETARTHNKASTHTRKTTVKSIQRATEYTNFTKLPVLVDDNQNINIRHTRNDDIHVGLKEAAPGA